MGTLTHALSINPLQGEIILFDDAGVHLSRTRERRSRLTAPRRSIFPRLQWKTEDGVEHSLDQTSVVSDNELLCPSHKARQLHGDRLITENETAHDCQKYFSKIFTLEECLLIRLVYVRGWSPEEVARFFNTIVDDGQTLTDVDVRRCIIQAVKRARKQFGGNK